MLSQGLLQTEHLAGPGRVEDEGQGGSLKRRWFVLLAVGVLGSLVVAAVASAGFPNLLRFKEPVLVDGFPNLDRQPAATAVGAEADSGFADPRVFVDGIVVVGIKEGVVTRLTAPFEAVYVCVNGGGNVPDADNKTTFVGELEASATFAAAKNGKATGSLLTPPVPTSADVAAATGFACPSGQTLAFDQVVFSNMVLSVDGGETVQFDTVLVSPSLHGVT